MEGLLQDGVALSDRARMLHGKMVAKGPSALFTQLELKDVTNSASLTDLMSIVQELLDKNLLKLIKQNNELKFQAVDFAEAQKKAAMTADEALVYSYIEASGREGIWTKTIKARTNLHTHVVLKCLKSLESQRYVKSVKSVKFPTRKIYMLYNLQPSIEVTGGPWFTDSELDVEFINSLLTIVWRFVAERTYPKGFNNFTGGKEALYASHVNNFASTDDILEFIIGAKVANVELSTSDIRSLCQVLVYDDKLEKVTFDCYSVTLQSILEMTQPEGQAEKDAQETFSIFKCHNVIAPSSSDNEAIYLDEWTL
ncbi:LANO_0G14862g1_1 [Lachancea nothofagi CBS 11611]|uniref:DNA-directed RNA polymerase III subunit RPC6 n=1 Tax=Lachancea nothofagi CBS 11611 TaxID=1266666 RepID=A0A1G4KK87_9SACH|nr:LANO_0G14862g1_1 [Lachancea nothofagi CBS 11611]